ncbi:MAG: response regulator [Clostridiales bacterium]|nr:response regulator [Clostridiales bacterium]
MSKERFLIIDDDPGICQMLENIIEDHDLGEVIDTINDGLTGIDMIPKYKPDIVFVDLLLPDIDGIEIVKKIKEKYDDIDFIMISQVSDQDMISEAYGVGIGFYINKPINVIEVTSVTKGVIASQRNRKVLAEINQTLSKRNTQPIYKEEDYKEKVKIIFAEVGILSEKGSHDLLEIIDKVHLDRKDIQMSKLYKFLSQKYAKNGEKRSSSYKAIEQRVRRTIQTAMVNVAHLGLEDFSNYRFERYAATLFGFQEIRKVMDSIRKDETIKATINIKQFINGIISLIN